MRGELGAEERDEVGVHGGGVVGPAGDDDGLVGEFGGEAGGHPGGVFRAGRAGRVVRRGVEQGHGPGGAASHRWCEPRKRRLVFPGAAGGVGRRKKPGSHEAGRAGSKSRDRV